MEAFRRFANPLFLNLQKMELELTCPICLKLFQKPMLLPCNHISCSDCLLALSENGHDCSVCKEVFSDQDVRPSMYIETMVTIYRSMSSTINAFINKGSHDGVAEKYAASVGSPYCNNTNSKKQINCLVGHKPEYIKPIEMDMHNTEAEDHPKEKEPNSPESFSEPKGSDYGSNYSGSEPGINKSAILSKRDLNFERCQQVDDHVKESKKQKLNNSYAGFINSQSTYNCSFCHISNVTEASGEMLHLLDGKEIVESDASNSNILHVHQKCIEWAPQAYFVDDKVMNLEAELARSSKIKCTRCGLKGAALGCYVKNCRRSYHVPCAAEVSGCRWDTVNFLLLCPVHSSNKLPCDRSNVKRKKPSSDNRTLYDDSLQMDQVFPEKKLNLGLWTAPTSVTREWLLCGSGLSKREKDIMDRFVSLTGIATTSNWDTNVTHVVAATDERGACARTLKLLMAILNGKWVVSIEWLKASMEAGFAVSEEPYEITHDIHGSFDGPRTGRLRAMKKEPKLFAGLTFHFFGHFVPHYKPHLVNLVLAAGGEVLEHCEIFPTTLVVYSCDPPQGDDPKDIDDFKRRKEEAECFAARTWSKVVAHTWLLDTIAACSLPQDA